MPTPNDLPPHYLVIDLSTGHRPAVLGGECSSCLHAPPAHEPTCALVRMALAPEPTILPPVPGDSDEAATSPLSALLWFADEGHYSDTYRHGAGFASAHGLSIARKALGLPVDRIDNTLMPLREALSGGGVTMKIRTLLEPPYDGHTSLLVTFADGSEHRCCGETFCGGECRLPALVVPGRVELKARSNAVAFGQVFQPWIVEWTGAKVEVPEAERGAALKMYWM